MPPPLLPMVTKQQNLFLINLFIYKYFLAVYLCKRTMQNKAHLELEDFEAENLAKLQKMFSRKWEFVFMQAEAQYKYVSFLAVFEKKEERSILLLFLLKQINDVHIFF